MKNLNKRYIRTIRNYIAEIEGDFINLYKPTFIQKLNKDIIPSLLSLNKKLKQFELEKELRFNNIIINCLNSLNEYTNIEIIINNLYCSISQAEEGEQC
ncbi:MAG: hypothetical protein ACRDBY_01045 [Cetobacterium sp.]